MPQVGDASWVVLIIVTMNHLDVFVIHKRNLYAHKAYNDPLGGDITHSKTTNPDLLPDSGNESVSYVVDWQLQISELRKFGEKYNPDSKSEYGRTDLEDRSSGQSSTVKERSPYISDW